MNESQREAFVRAMSALLEEDPSSAIVLADISVDRFEGVAARHPGQVVNVGIREQAMVGVAAGMALAGMRVVAHSYAPFLVERAFEQVKLDFSHQGLPGVLVSVGASYDDSESGRTHQAPGDVGLLDTLQDWTVLVPGHPGEVDGLLRQAVGSGERAYLRLAEGINDRFGPSPAATSPEGAAVVRQASDGAPFVLAVGPLLDNVLAATEGLDVAVGHVTTVRPFPADFVRRVTGSDVVIVEPYLAGTSAHVATVALSGGPHRICSLGVGQVDLHRYGTWREHERAHSLDATRLASSIRGFLQGAESSPNSGRSV